MKLLAGTLVLAALFLSACQAPKAVELPAPQAQVSVVHFAGTPLSGPTTRPAETTLAPLQANELLGVHVTLVALSHMPQQALDSLGAHARLITVWRGDQPLLATARLTLEARYGQFPVPLSAAQLGSVVPPSSTGPVRVFADLRGVLPAGVTVSFRAADKVWLKDPLSGQPIQRNVRVDLFRPTQPSAPLQVALSQEDLVPPTGGGEPPSMQRETVLLDPPEGPALVLITPFTFTASPARALAMVIDISRGAGPAFAPAIEACQRELSHPPSIPVTAESSFDWMPSAIATALNELDRPASRRAALVFLGDQTGAQVLPDLALVADDTVLARLVAKIHARPAVHAGAAPVFNISDQQALGWQLDLAALQLLHDMQSAGQLPRDLSAVLLAYAGEAGRHPSSLDEILTDLPDRAELQRRLISENRQYLEDGSPAARIGAYDWLAAHGQAPAGYDPLGSPRARSQALEKARHPSTPGETP